MVEKVGPRRQTKKVKRLRKEKRKKIPGQEWEPPEEKIYQNMLLS